MLFQQAGDTSIGWALGYMLNLTNMIPAEKPSSHKKHAVQLLGYPHPALCGHHPDISGDRRLPAPAQQVWHNIMALSGGLACRALHCPSCWSLHGLNTWDAASAQRCPAPMPDAACPRRKAAPSCPPFAFKLHKERDRKGLLAWQDNVLRASQCYSGTDPRADSGFGHSDLGHLPATRPGLNWVSKSRQ